MHMADDWSNWVPILGVKDARRSAQFYSEALGFEMDWEHRYADGFPLYVQLTRPPLTLHLSEHGDSTHPAEFFVRVPDVDALYTELLERGIQPARELTDQPYGMRDFCIVDPDGHRITLGTPAGFPTEFHREPDVDD